MLKNYIIIGIRNILKHKFYSLINILGLTIGITAALFIVLYIIDELSYEDFHKDADRIYRIGLIAQLSGQNIQVFSSPPPMAKAMAEEIPEVESSCRLWNWDDVIIRYNENSYTEDKFYLVDSNFFEIFTFELVKGDPSTVFQDPESIVLTETMAKKYFGEEDPIGKILIVANHRQAMKVTGVAADPPHNTHIRFNFLLPIYSQQYMRTNDRWLNNFLRTYFKVYTGSDLDRVQSKLKDMVVQHVGPELQQAMGISIEQFMEQDEGTYGFVFNPIQDIHLKSNLQFELEPPSDIKYLYIFGAIGIFILVIGAINFMNLSTARSAGRTREVGMRKTFGSLRHQLIFQFLTESLIYTFIAAICSIVLFAALLPEFNLISAKAIDYTDILNRWMILGLSGIVLLVGFLAGSYPAFYLSKFGITEVLKGKLSKGMKGGLIRGMLVVLQFTISIFMIICTSVVYKQLIYTQNKDLGFNKDKVMVINNANRLENSKKVFKQELLSNHGINSVSFASNSVLSISNTNAFRKEGSDEDHLVAQYWADYDQLEVYQFELAAGRFFSRDFPSDSSAVILNKSAAKAFGWENPIGENVLQLGQDGFTTLQVVGVVKDFNFESLRNEIRPMMINFVGEQTGSSDMRANMLNVRFNTDDHREAINTVTSVWKKYSNGEPLEFSFVDQNLDEMYRAEQQLGQLFSIFTLIAIFIASLGLFALASFTSEQRTKEIGIRKAMGASGFNIVRLLSLEFTKYVFIGFLIAIFPAYYFINQWLESFAYRVDYGFAIFVLSGLAGFLIAMLTVTYQSVKAARTNPSTALRYE